MGYSSEGCKELDTTEHARISILVILARADLAAGRIPRSLRRQLFFNIKKIVYFWLRRVFVAASGSHSSLRGVGF